MSELVQLGRPVPKSGAGARRPEWLRVKVTHTETYSEVGRLLDGLGLHTVCEEARCPNIWECWGAHRTATFMILGDVCTRNCRYCSVTSGKPAEPPHADEPANVAEAVARLGLRHAVVTSVDRDDLDDYGSTHWVRTIEAIRARAPGCAVELLIPDFLGDAPSLERVLAAGPDVLGHNVETVPRLFKRMRSKGDYERTLELLARADAHRNRPGVRMTTKTGMMLGLGETADEVVAVMDDLRRVNVDVLTLGQYLNPTMKHAPIARFYSPEEFAELKGVAMAKGFRHCEAGPLVRSSYHAHEHVAGR